MSALLFAEVAAENAAQTWTSTAVVSVLVTSVAMLIKSLVDKRIRPAATPSDDNEATRLGNEFLSSLLKDARDERKELRETIKGLEADGTTKQSRIDALSALDRKKSAQITALERRAEAAAQKLRAGIPLTIADILGPGHELATELLGDGLEDTAINS